MITDTKKQVLEHFTQGRRFYKLMDFKSAKASFAAALAADPSDGPSKVYLERCEYYTANPPPEDWDGVFTMTTK